jgi:GTP:adenosylcobinamide-phosphate guanylyltransferase
MNTPNGTYKEWVMKSNTIRDSGSPQDLVGVIRAASAVTGTVDVPFANASKVNYVLLREATVVKDVVTGKLEVDFDEAADAIVGIMIFGTEQQKQITNITL